MMDVREKLVELQSIITCPNAICNFCEHFKNKSACERHKKEVIADNMIAHGVTVQEWISVKDRLPEYPGHYLVCTSINYWHGGCMDINENHKYHPNGTPVGYDGSTMSVLDCYYDVTGHWNRVCDSHVTHWMPIPEPPKGE